MTNGNTKWDGPHVCGQWAFSGNVTKEQVLLLATEWRDNEDGKMYVQLLVRNCGGGKHGAPKEYGIWFIRKLEEDDPQYKKFFHKMTDKLKRRFGNDLTGWDISSNPTILI